MHTYWTSQDPRLHQFRGRSHLFVRKNSYQKRSHLPAKYRRHYYIYASASYEPGGEVSVFVANDASAIVVLYSIISAMSTHKYVL